MPLRPDVLTDRRFWAFIFGTTYGVVDDDAAQAAICASLALKPSDTEEWSNDFTGWYPGIFDKSDGYQEDPSALQ